MGDCSPGNLAEHKPGECSAYINHDAEGTRATKSTRKDVLCLCVSKWVTFVLIMVTVVTDSIAGP